ncbi:MAG TPA: hypothetical protein VGX92_18730 [Pyrinomonadaceae bacterium]|jgi:hypothetical protein|nr:hypothetical protein [Pyrinomonadaceae bacterium]
MKLILSIMGCLLVVASVQAQHPRKFDEYGNIRFSDEKARLYNLALQLQREPTYVAYLIVYAGRKACVGEARFRAVRAKNYLVNRGGIEADRIIWVDAGHREELTVELWAYPPWIGEPYILADVDKRDVQIIRNCSSKYKGRQRPFNRRARLTTH